MVGFTGRRNCFSTGPTASNTSSSEMTSSQFPGRRPRGQRVRPCVQPGFSLPERLPSAASRLGFRQNATGETRGYQRQHQGRAPEAHPVGCHASVRRGATSLGLGVATLSSHNGKARFSASLRGPRTTDSMKQRDAEAFAQSCRG
jgi:hypothetical protein